MDATIAIEDFAREQFPFVETDIGRILVGPAWLFQQSTKYSDIQSASKFHVERWNSIAAGDNSAGERRLEIVEKRKEDVITVHDLIPLACQCDRLLFAFNTSFDPPQHAGCLENHPKDDLMVGALTNLAARNATAPRGDNAAGITISLMLALNALESTLRQSIPGGRAPLLTTLLARYRQQQSQKVSSDSSTSDSATIAKVLDLILLPNTGLNLRNLLWHGFCGASTSLRPWLALTLVLLGQLLGQQERPRCSPATADEKALHLSESPLFRNAPRVSAQSKKCLMDVVARGKSLREELGSAETSNLMDLVAQCLLPGNPRHLALWEFCLTHLQSRSPTSIPVIVSVVLTMLLEHGLRLLWCSPSCNDRPLDRIARHHHFYVTLDGHGQRHKHNVLLHPFLGDDNQQQNRLVYKLGGSTMALLTDIFISGCGGPNLRAALSHGVFDAPMEEELYSLANDYDDKKTDWSHTADEKTSADWDVVDILLATMERVGTAVAAENVSSTVDSWNYSSTLPPYRPIFSFTACTVNGVADAQLALGRLDQLTQDASSIHTTTNVVFPGFPDSMSELSVPSATSKKLHAFVTSRLTTCSDGPDGSTPWTADNVFVEHEQNRILERLGATRSLFSDIVVATTAMHDNLREALWNVGDEDGINRKPVIRLVACSRVVGDIHAFAIHVGVSSLYQALGGDRNLTDGEMLKAVERTRMMVSTVSTFVMKNPQRAWKAVEQYAKGKVVKKLVEAERD